MVKITIAGLPGSGKTSLLHKFSYHYKVKPISIGDMRGEFAKIHYGENIDQLNQRRQKDPSVDTNFDEYQKNYMHNTKSYIIEGRIFKRQRLDEQHCNTLQEVVQMLNTRMQSDKESYQKLYNTNCYDASNFDIIIDTTRTDEEHVFNETILRMNNNKKRETD